jgi:hypothetical protein
MSRSLMLGTVAVMSLTLVGCASSPRVSRGQLDARRAELDKVTVAFAAPEGCQQLENVYADDYNVGRIERAMETARMRVQLKALELGANYVQAPPAQIIYGQYGPTGAAVQGVGADRCPHR